MRSRAPLLLALVTAACGGGPLVAPPPVPPPPPPRHVATGAPPPTTHVAPLGPEASAISFTRMAKFPEPGWNVPRAIQLSPDEKLVTYLASEDGSDRMSVMAFDRATRKTSVLLRGKDLPATTRPRSREEELRRERTRSLVEGITGYRWAKSAPVMLIPHGGDLFLRDAAGAVSRLTDTAEPEIDPHVCDNGAKVAFVRKGELVVLDVATKKETELTKGAPEGVTRGLSDFNAQEEFGEESGFWLSPSCDKIAYVEVDERKVESTPVLGWRGGKPDLMMQKYPPPGGTNPSVRLGVLDLATRKTTWVTWPDASERYLGIGVRWTDDGKDLVLQVFPRSQKNRQIVKVDGATGKSTVLVEESSEAWMETTPVRHLKGGEMLYTSDASGHRHLVLRGKDGKRTTLTQGDWDVTQISGVDEDKRTAFVVGTKESTRERHLYAVSLAGGEPRKITEERGSHRITMDERARAWVDLHSAKDRPPRAAIVEGGKVLGEIPIALDEDFQKLGIRAPEHLTIKSPGGEVLNASLLRPRNVVPGGKHPAIVDVYGGPTAQLVMDAWMPGLLWQHLADRGFFVLRVDNRGSAGRGPAFERLVHKKLGQLELEDQVAGAAFLASLPEVDGARIGIVGHSYGGFMSALAMLKAPGRFAAGVSIAPVTDWALYDSAYTERFMETPKENPAGYAAADLSKAAGGLAGPLLLVHGNMDENVHYTNTAKLVEALVAANKPFEQVVVPGERHFMRNTATRAWVDERIIGWLVERLR